MIEMISGGLIYRLAKELQEYLKYTEADKEVGKGQEWLDKSGFGDHMTDEGYRLHWSLIKDVALKELDGWEVAYEIDKEKKLRNRLIWNSELILMARADDDT